MQGTVRSGSGLRVSTGWTRARWLRQWAQTATAALAVDFCGVEGIAGSGLAAGGTQEQMQGMGRAQHTTVVQGRNTGRGGGLNEGHEREGSGECDRNVWRCILPPPPPPPPCL